MAKPLPLAALGDCFPLQAGLKRTSEHPSVPPVSTTLPLSSVEKELCDGEIVTVFNAKPRLVL